MIVTLLTDFGGADHYVGVMKGIILGVSERSSIVDISHEIPCGNIEAAAYLLLAAYPYFPPGTVHVAVVDPGVGTARRPIVVLAGGQSFVGPDNGLFSYVLEREPDAHTLHITQSKHFRRPVSATFHGRDIFAPVAAALANGAVAESFGPEIGDPVRLPALNPRPGPDGSLLGRFLHIDHFGNCVTSITREDLAGVDGGVHLCIGGVSVTTIRQDYAGDDSGRPFVNWGSSGFLEISVKGASAADALGLRAGDQIEARGVRL